MTPREIRLTLGSVMLVMLLAALDQTIVGTAMPRIVADLRGFDQYAWVTTSYMLSSTTIVPIVGKLSDIYGRKRFYLLGLAIFLVGSALCGAAPDMLTLIAFRAIQGVGAGIVMAIAFIVIGDLFPPAQRGRLQGLFAGVFGISALIGPPLGGYLTDHASWRWAFYVNLPLGIIALGVVARFFPRIPTPPRRGAIDILGAIALVGTTVPLLLALSWGGRQYPWSDPRVVALLVVGLAFMAALVTIERRTAEPIIPPALFRNRIIALSIAASFCMSIGMFGVILFVPLFVQAVLGGTASESGSVLLPMMLGMILASGVSGVLISRTGRYRPFAVVGMALMVVGLFALSRLGTDATLTSAGLVLALIGAGLGSVMPTFTIAVQNAAEPRMLGAATSSAQFFRQIGGTIGGAVLGALMAAQSTADLDARLAALRPALEATLDRADPTWAAIADSRALLDTLGRADLVLAAPVLAAARAAVGSSLSTVFFIGSVAVAVGLVAAILVPEIPLRKERHMVGRAPESASA
ncbi:MAG: DHA2 family efflux MFS transporter permease subunit [Chloroflexota bacterium]|nr:MAG: DHA2 family efflux MFS transporter permease subunit [Chloroflexota bacterium]